MQAESEERAKERKKATAEDKGVSARCLAARTPFHLLSMRFPSLLEMGSMGCCQPCLLLIWQHSNLAARNAFRCRQAAAVADIWLVDGGAIEALVLFSFIYFSFCHSIFSSSFLYPWSMRYGEPSQDICFTKR